MYFILKVVQYLQLGGDVLPIKIPRQIPAYKKLEAENIFVMDEKRALSQEIRPLKIVIVNLMPLKELTELDIMRALSNTPLQIDITLLQMETHISKNTSAIHLEKFYATFSDIKNKRFDGMIITGAPLEMLEFEEVTYWDELTEIMEWSKDHVTSTFHICWAAQAGMYYHYGVRKVLLKEKLSGIYSHRVIHRTDPLVRGFDDYFFAPHSRYSEVCREDIVANGNFKILADSKEAGLYLVTAEEGKNVFVMGHPEYDRLTLDNEYNRDKNKGLNPCVPIHYYPNNDPKNKPRLQWRSHANSLYTNWLNYYVYQVTPYII